MLMTRLKFECSTHMKQNAFMSCNDERQQIAIKYCKAAESQ